MSSRVYAYVAGVWVLAIVAIATLAPILPSVSHDARVAAYWFSALGALGQLLTFQRRQKGVQGSVSALPVLSALVIAPTLETIALATVVSLIGELVRRKPLVKRVFNVALYIIAAAAAAGSYVAVARGTVFPFHSAGLGPLLLAFAAASLSHSVVTAGLLAGVLRASEGAKWLGALATLMKETVIGDILTVPFIFFCVRVFLSWGGVGVIILTIPLIGMRQLFFANAQLRQINEELLELMVAAIEARDPYTSGHSRRVAEYSRLIAERIGLSPKTVDEVAKAALLHDVGKMDEQYAPLLRKPSRLTREEELVMQGHAARSAELVAKVSSLKGLVGPVRHHHEAWDGTGYPDGLAGERIPLASRIIAFADTIDAMTSERPYRSGLSPEIVRAEIVRCRGTQFDPAIADRVVSAEIWAALFPAMKTSDDDQTKAARALTLVRVPHRRFG